MRLQHSLQQILQGCTLELDFHRRFGAPASGLNAGPKWHHFFPGVVVDSTRLDLDGLQGHLHGESDQLPSNPGGASC